MDKLDRHGLVVQALMGLSAGADYASCIKVIVSWFARQDRGKAMGLFLIASSLGVAATNAIVPSLVAAIGWQGVYRVLGCATLAVALLTFLTLRDGRLTTVLGSRPRVGLGTVLRNRSVNSLAILPP